jgi:hypothetical protein
MNYKKPLVYFVVLSTLFSLVPVVPFNYSSAATCDPDALRPVSYGQRGSAVRNAQACLIEADYDIPAGATGYYGSQTRNAVREFYKDWYGAWPGDRLGPQGVQQLRSLLAGGSQQSPGPDNEQPTPEKPQQEQQNNQLNQFMQLLTFILALSGVNLDATTINQLMQAFSSGNFTELATLITNLRQQQQQQQQQQQEQQTVEEGFLTVERDPKVAAVTLREGGSGKVVGLRFRANNGAVSVKSIFLRWTGSAAPHRVISALKLVDSQGNVLYQTNVGPNTFERDQSLNYYLPISGLNVNVPKNGNTSVFVEVTIVGTLPSGVNSLSFAVRQNDVRGRDGVGIDRYGPSSDLAWSASLLANLAGQARFIGSINSNTPKQGYVVGSDENNGRGERVKVLSFDLTAKSDNLMVTKITGSVTNTSTVKVVYIARPGEDPLDSANPSNSGDFTFDIPADTVTINRDQTATFDILVDFEAPSLPSVATFTVSIATTTGVNSLGDNVSSLTQVTSELMRAVRVGPEFSKVSADVQRSYNQQTNTSTVTSITYVLNIKPNGGQIYIPTSSAATATLSGGTSTSVSLNVKEVRLGTTLLNHDGNKYTLNENQTYKVTYEKIATIAQYPDDVKVVSQLSEFIWSPNGTNWINADFLSGFPEYRVEK